MIESIDMKHSSKMAWKKISRLNCDPAVDRGQTKVTPNRVASCLIANGMFKGGKSRPQPKCTSYNLSHVCRPFEPNELLESMKELKNGKACGIDGLFNEQITHFGPIARNWLLQFYCNCLERCRVPKQWRQAKVIALPKPKKDPSKPENYRPISLLSHGLKLFERLIYNRIVKLLDPAMIPEQAGFRPGKNSTGQILSMCQHIEDGFENKLLTGAVFVDLTAAYDTVNKKIMLQKLFKMTQDRHLTSLIAELMSNRRFFVQMGPRKSKWKVAKNGLPQGGVLAPLLFNVYTNDQPLSTDTRSFIYADDRATLAQGKNKREVEEKLMKCLSELSDYYHANRLKANPGKTVSCMFHLNNRQAAHALELQWNSVKIEHDAGPKYLGVTLDRMLSFKQHCENFAGKIQSKNNLLSKLANSRWGANPHVLRTTALAMCYSVAEYACPVWLDSTHSKLIDVALNETCRKITACMKSTPINQLYNLSGIAPPLIRRKCHLMTEKQKQETDPRHPLYGALPLNRRLKSRYSFLNKEFALQLPPEKYKERFWRLQNKNKFHPTNYREALPSGGSLKWCTWKTLNRLRCLKGRSKDTLKKWGIITDNKCACVEVQTMEHIVRSSGLTMDQLSEATPEAVQLAEKWQATL